MARMDSRRARRMMKQMGMKMDELGDVHTVILQGKNREIVIEGPAVTSINVRGRGASGDTRGGHTSGSPAGQRRYGEGPGGTGAERRRSSTGYTDASDAVTNMYIIVLF